MLPDLLHGEEKKVWGDGGYQGQSEAIREVAPEAQDMTCRRTRYKDGVDEEARRKKPDQVQSTRQGGVALPHPEAYLRFHQGALPRLIQESSVVVRRVRVGESVPAPQTVDPARGIVSAEAGKRPPRTQKR